jgi:hypothetical protein
MIILNAVELISWLLLLGIGPGRTALAAADEHFQEVR